MGLGNLLDRNYRIIVFLGIVLNLIYLFRIYAPRTINNWDTETLLGLIMVIVLWICYEKDREYKEQIYLISQRIAEKESGHVQTQWQNEEIKKQKI